ncbi:MAG TPA: PilZ domain-containing protein [Candidatus Sulfotelmatobacter sp.]|nr:PilZ domain-containing protein [Candidatus Sulfotelmatobacter sp.]
MTPEMAFECLLVTHDPAVFRVMNGILQDFSITTKICSNASKAVSELAGGGTDLIVVDLEASDSSEFLGTIGALARQKPTVLAVADADCVVPGVHVVLRKPVTQESGLASLKAAYSKMVRDYRKHTRFAVMRQVVATDEGHRRFNITVTNVGRGGIGLTSVETVRVGGTLSFAIRLPELQNEIFIQARVLWTRPYGAAGCEFVHVAPFDLQLLHAWLENRYRIKKPLIPV